MKAKGIAAKAAQSGILKIFFIFHNNPEVKTLTSDSITEISSFKPSASIIFIGFIILRIFLTHKL